MSMSKPHIRVVAARIEQDGKFLLTQRNPHAVLPLLWEFPGGRVEDGETDEAALSREISENIGVSLAVQGLSMHVIHEYERYHLDMLVYHATIADEPSAKAVNAVRWVSPSDFAAYQFPGADQQTVDALLGE
jgi:8-oxo-dGTP diphosphatase